MKKKKHSQKIISINLLKSSCITRVRKAFLFLNKAYVKHCDIMDQKIALRGRADKESLHKCKMITSASITEAQCYLYNFINANAYKVIQN